MPEAENNLEFGGVSVRKEMLAAWLFRAALFVAVVWLSENFVSKKSYELDKKFQEERRELVLQEMRKTSDALIAINGKMERDLERDKIIGDHETRLRVLEHKPTN